MEPLLIHGNTDTGLRRKANQDAMIMQPLGSKYKMLGAVIDGVGGYAGGERAAAVAKNAIEQYMQTPSGDTLTMLREAVVYANNRIANERTDNEQLREMCCVLTAVVADAAAQRIYFVHVGDTRLYRFRDQKLQKLTRDHSLVGVQEDAGELSEQDAMKHPHRNQILREVGSTMHRLNDDDFLDYGTDALVPGDLLLLCSDGLTDMLTSEEISAILTDTVSLCEATDQLINSANNAGGADNITVILLHCAPANLLQPPIDSSPVVSNEMPVTRKKAVTPKRTTRDKTLLPGVVLLGLLAVAGWYCITPPHSDALVLASPKQPVSTVDTVDMPISHRIIHAAIPGPVESLATDTLRISATQDYGEIKRYLDSSGHALVMMPKDSNPSFAAIAIKRTTISSPDTIFIKNLKFNGFQTGINIYTPVTLLAQNVAFENTPTPIRYIIPPREKQKPLVFMISPNQ